MSPGASRFSHFPTCLNQERALLSRELARRNSFAPPSQHLHFALHLRGVLKFGALEGALNEVVGRHSALRLDVFPNLGLPAPERERRLERFLRTGILFPGSYLQSIVAPRRPELDIVDARQSGSPEDCLLEALHHHGSRSFDGVPLIRASLIRTSEEEHFLLLTLDHIAADGWSARLVRDEVEELYQQLALPSAGRISDVKTSFPDFALWQRNALQTPYFNRAITYWRNQWSRFGAARVSFRELPFALPQPKASGFDFGTELFHVEPAAADAVRSFARKFDASVHTVFLSAYVLLLHHYTGKGEVAIWGHFFNRVRPEFQSVVGYFANTHLLGFEVSSSLTASDVLKQVRHVLMSGYGHQELPLPHLWRVLRCHPRFPDASLLLDYRSGRVGTSRGTRSRSAALQMNDFRLPAFSAPRWSSLGIYVFDSGREMWLRSQYLCASYPASAVQHLLSDLYAVVSRMVAEPTSPVSTFADVAGRYSSKPRYRDESMGEFLVLGADLIPNWCPHN